MASPSRQPQITIAVQRLRLIETGEELQLWQTRARRQWGNGSGLSIRISTATNNVGTTPPMKLALRNADGTTTLASNYPKARATAECGDDGCPSSLGLAGVSWESMDWRFPVKSAAAATTVSKGIGGIAARVESGNSTTVVLEVISHEKIPGAVLGLATIDIEPFATGEQDCFGASLHVFPNGAIADTTVHGVLDIELQRGLSGTTPEPLHDENEHVSLAEHRLRGFPARHSGTDLYFPSFLMDTDGSYVVSNVVAVKNTSDTETVRGQIELGNAPRHVGDGLRMHPNEAVIVPPQQTAFFSLTWSSATKPVLPQAAISLRLERSGQVTSAPNSMATSPNRDDGSDGGDAADPGASGNDSRTDIAESAPEVPSVDVPVTVFFTPPHAQEPSRAFHYWVNTVPMTNRRRALSRHERYVRSILPVFMLQHAVEDDGSLLVTDKDSGQQQFLAAPSGVASPIVNTPQMRSPTGSFRTSPNADNRSGARRSLQRFNIDKLGCCAVLRFGDVRGLPVVNRRARDVGPWFKIVVLATSDGWERVDGETSVVTPSPSGVLRFGGASADVAPSAPTPVAAGKATAAATGPNAGGDTQGPSVNCVTLRKEPSAATSQALRLALMEVGADGDEVPVGAAIVSLPSLVHVPATIRVPLAFQVFDSFSHYDELPNNSLLCTGVALQFLLDQ